MKMKLIAIAIAGMVMGSVGTANAEGKYIDASKVSSNKAASSIQSKGAQLGDTITVRPRAAGQLCDFSKAVTTYGIATHIVTVCSYIGSPREKIDAN